MSTMYHMSISVRGILQWSRREWKKNISIFTDDNGGPMTIDQVRNELLDHLQQGHTTLPTGPCENFSYTEGCLGHPIEEKP